MTDLRRNLLWGVFIFSLVMLWDAWGRAHGEASIFFPAPHAKTVANAAAPASGVPAATGTAAAAVAAAPAASAASAVVGELVKVRTDVVEATFDTKGADLVRLELLKHPSQEHPGQNIVLFERSAEHTYLAQTGLISQQPGLALPTHLSLMTLQAGPRQLADGANELVVRFESATGGSAQLIKTFTFKRGDYAVGVRHEVRNTSEAAISPELYLQIHRDGNVPKGGGFFSGPNAFVGPAIYTEAKKYKKIDFTDIAADKVDYDKTADNGWIALVQHHYASAWLYTPTQQRSFRTAQIEPNVFTVAMVLPLGQVAPGATKTLDAQLFAGPQEEKKLAALAPGLELLKDYGVLTILAKPLFWLLDHLHTLLGNWGWAIVALVVLLKIAFFGLNRSAYRSTAKMKALNPRIQEMRERLKDKPQEMQQEMMRIYREEKVNPLGSCLPILVQMPFFFALYWVLFGTVELRNAPWIGWIHDLSVPDPLYILPVLMTASQLFATWLNPMPTDPAQAKMMWIMPLVFSVMFFFFPAGLVLYWFVNNLLGVAQQWYITNQITHKA